MNAQRTRAFLHHGSHLGPCDDLWFRLVTIRLTRTQEFDHLEALLGDG